MRVWIKQSGLPLLATIAFIALSFSATLWARNRGLLKGLEFQAYDRMVARRATTNPEASACVIVGITEPDIKKLVSLNDYPMSDRTMAGLLEKLSSGNPSAIVLDVIRDQSKPHYRATTQEEADDFKRFKDALTQNRRIVLPIFIGDRFENRAEIEPSVVRILKRFQQGAADTLPDSDRVVRLAGLFISSSDADHPARAPSLAFQAAMIHLQQQSADKAARISLDKSRNGVSGILKIKNANAPATREILLHEPTDGAYIATAIAEAKARASRPATHDDGNGYFLPLDCGGPKYFTTFSLADVMADTFDAGVLANRVVFIGTTAESVHDYFHTSMAGQEYGVVGHARVADQLIRLAGGGQAQIKVPGVCPQQISLMILCLMGGVLGWVVRSYWRFFVVIALIEISLVSSASTAMLHGWWLPVVPLGIGLLLSAGSVSVYRSYRERLDRLAMMQLFERSVSGDVAKAIWARRDEIFDHGRLRTRKQCATVLFTDLEGFSAVAEALGDNPEALIDWLNEYFQKISDLVCRWGGNINKFNGDQIVAVFGPPLDRTDEQVTQDARGAVDCAVEMRNKLRELNSDFRLRNMPEIGMRIGIHTGTLVAGSLGSRDRQEWTVIGDTVNIASRLESFDKKQMNDDIAAARCRILISECTHKRLDGTKLRCRSLGSHELAGRKQKTEVFGVMDYIHPSEPPPSSASQSPAHLQGSSQPCIGK